MDLYYLSSDIRLAAALAEASIAPIRTRLNNKDPFKKQTLKSAFDWEQRGRSGGREGKEKEKERKKKKKEKRKGLAL